MTFKIRISQKVFLLFLVMSMIPILTLLLLSENLDERITENKLDDLSKNVAHMGSMIESFIDSRISDMELLSNDDVLKYETANKDILLELKKIQQIHPYYEEISIIDIDGKTLVSTDDSIVKDWSNDTWFKKSLDGSIAMSDIYYDQIHNDSIFLLFSPVYDTSDNLVWVVSSTINLHHIYEIISSVRVGSTGYYELSDNKRNLVYNPMNLDMSGSEYDFNCSSTHVSYLNYLGEKEIKANYPILLDRVLDGNGCWQVFASQTEKEIFSSITSINGFIYSLILFLLMFSLLVSIVFSRTLTKPIVTLSNTARKIIGGDMTIRTRIDSDDEIGELSSHFDQMVEMFIRIQEELHQKNYDLKKLDETKDNFLAVVSHELRTPLTSIRSFSQLMYEGLLGKVSKKQKEGLGVIMKSEDQLTRLINDILELTRYESGKNQPTLLSTDINNIIRHGLMEFRPTLKKIGAELKLDFLNKTRIIKIDKDKILQMIRNIIGNSIKYRSERKLLLEVRVEESKDDIRLIFRDNGIGIDNKHIDKVFDKFYQIDQTMSRGGEGTGLGLSITKHIVESHHGRIFFESKLGKCTKVTVLLPK